MADLWVSSVNGNDANDGSTKALAKASVYGASGIESIVAVGDLIRIDSAHNEKDTGANVTITFPNGSNPAKLISINWTSEAYEAGALLGAGTGTSYSLKIEGSVITRGVTFEAHNGIILEESGTGTTKIQRHINPTFNLANTSSGKVLKASTGDARYRTSHVTLINPTIDFAAAGGNYIQANGVRLSICGGSVTGSVSTATGLLHAQGGGVLHCADMDVSSQTIPVINAGSGSNTLGSVKARRIKTSSGQSLISSAGGFANDIEVIGADNGDGYYHFHKMELQGECLDDTGIYKTSGASIDGLHSISARFVGTTDSVKNHFPIRYKLFEGYIDTTDYTTTIDFEMELARDGSATKYNDDEFWIELEHPDGADNALGVFVDSRPGELDTPAALTTSTASWTGLGGTNAKMKLNITTTIGVSAGNIASGMVTIWGCFAPAAVSTVYADPDVTIT